VRLSSVGASADELSESDIASLRDTLKRFDEIAHRRAAVQAARNQLETAIVEMRERVRTASFCSVSVSGLSGSGLIDRSLLSVVLWSVGYFGFEIK
jgi:hypothetical protein